MGVVRSLFIASGSRFLWTRAGSIALLGAVGLAVGTPLTGQRTVVGNTIRSPELPSASIHVDETMTHVGGTSFELYGVADVEIHLFVEAEGGRVKRLLWVQFEGYHDDLDRSYDYSSDPTIEVDGRPIHVNARFYPTSGFGGRPGSDGDHVARLLRENGYRLGTDLARVRLVWLLNEPPRDELMFIYLEDLADHGLSVEDLGANEERWQELAQHLQSRGAAAFQIIENGPSRADRRVR